MQEMSGDKMLFRSDKSYFDGVVYFYVQCKVCLCV